MRALTLATSFVLSAAAAQAATIVNGSFEGPAAEPFETLLAGSTAIAGWTVGGHSVDWIGSYWEAADGNNSIDINGSGPGAISQLLTGLVIGREYTISFAMSGNPVASPVVKNLEISVGATSEIHSFDTTGVTLSDMQWVEHSFAFIAAASEELLTFSATRRGFFGPAIDDVRISAVPLPAAAPLLLAGLGGLVALGRRRRASAAR